MEIYPIEEHLAVNPMVTQRTKALLIALRQALIIALGALEDYLGMERSIIPKHSGGREARAGREVGR